MKKNRAKEIGSRLRALRKGKRLSQEKLARGLQLSKQTLSAWESGRATIGSHHLVVLSDLLECDLHLLLKGDDANRTPSSSEIVDLEVSG